MLHGAIPYIVHIVLGVQLPMQVFTDAALFIFGTSKEPNEIDIDSLVAFLLSVLLMLFTLSNPIFYVHLYTLNFLEDSLTASC